MEFEEVSNFIKMGHVDGTNLSTSSLQWQQSPTAEPFGSGNKGGGNGIHQVHFTNTKRPNPILGVSRLVNSVRRLKKTKDSNDHWQVVVSPLGTPSPSRPSSTPPQQQVPPNLHEIKYQMENFVVPANWHNHPDHPSFAVQTQSNILTGPRLIINLKECIARFEYLLDLEQQKLAAYHADVNNHLDKLQQLDTKIHQLNTQLTLERLERTSHMNETLRTVNARIPRLQNLRDSQKWTATKIEGYVKNSNLEKRLVLLETQTKTTHIEAVWARLRDWGPMMTIGSFLFLFILVIIHFGI